MVSGAIFNAMPSASRLCAAGIWPINSTRVEGVPLAPVLGSYNVRIEIPKMMQGTADPDRAYMHTGLSKRMVFNMDMGF
jgi:hypothetical protein